MKKAVFLIAILLIGLVWAFTHISTASAWELGAMNRQIESTNFIVDERCSGTLISVEHRLILTNHHCVQHKVKKVEDDVTKPDGTVESVTMERREPIAVSQKAYAGYTEVGSSRFMADIVAMKESRDLALLQLKQSDIPHAIDAPILPNDADIERGERVYIVGNPAMQDASVVEGVVSNVNRSIRLSGKNEDIPMVQFSGGVFGGNSGGALYNDMGELIGVPAAGHRWANFIGLAVPISEVKSALGEWCFASVYDPEANDNACRDAKDKEE